MSDTRDTAAEILARAHAQELSDIRERFDALAGQSRATSEVTSAARAATFGAIDTLGWVWGPLYGAMLVRFLSWKWQFYTNIPLAIIGFE